MNKLSIGLILIMILASTGCTPSEQQQLTTQAVQAGKTALAIGKTQGPPLETQAARLAMTAVVVARTESPPLQTQAVKLADTAVVIARTESPPLQTQAARLADTAVVIARTESPPLQTQAAYLVRTAAVIGKTESPPLQTRVARLIQTAIVLGGEAASTQAVDAARANLAQIGTELADTGQGVPLATPIPPAASPLPPGQCRFSPGQSVVPWKAVLDPCQLSLFGACLWPMTGRSHATYKVTILDATPSRLDNQVVAAWDGVMQDWMTWDAPNWNVVAHTNIAGFEPIAGDEYVVQPAGNSVNPGNAAGHLGICIEP